MLSVCEAMMISYASKIALRESLRDITRLSTVLHDTKAKFGIQKNT